MARDSDNAARAHHEDWGIIMSGGFSGADTDFTVTRNAEDFEDLALVPGKGNILKAEEMLAQLPIFTG